MHFHSNPIEPPPASPSTRPMQFSSQLVNVGQAKMPLNSTTRALIAVESQAARAMHAIYSLLKGNGHCGAKRTDAIQGEEKPIMRSRKNSEGDDDHGYPRNWFYVTSQATVLEIGDPSRNVIELIFKATTTDTTRCSITINQVLKLNNSRETLERFERFREGVKNRAFEYYTKHPRNIVDGNEQLLFYGMKITCCKRFGTSKLCRDSKCSICNITKSGSYTAMKKTGIWLSSSCQDFINANVNAETINVKMAIMVCRVITGRVIDMVDRDFEGGFDSITGVKSNYLFVKNPSAILPCFVIILNCRYF